MLQYERFNQLVAVAMSRTKDSVESRFVVSSRNLEVAFSEYVKSQIHLNISAELCNLPIALYVDTLRFIDGVKGCKNSALKVLRQFYLDMSGFLIKNPDNINLHVAVDCELGIPVINYDYPMVKEQLLGFSTSADRGLLDSDFVEIIDYVDNINDLNEKIDSYTVAAILLKECEPLKDEGIRKICIGGQR